MMKIELRFRERDVLIGTLFLVGRRRTSLAVPLRLPIYHWICFLLLLTRVDRLRSLKHAAGIPQLAVVAENHANVLRCLVAVK